MNQLGTTSHCSESELAIPSEIVGMRKHLEGPAVRQHKPTNANSRDIASDEKDQRLCELELKETVLAARIAALERDRRELECSYEALSTFYKESPVGYVTLSHSGNIREVNPATERMLGLKLNRLRRLPFTFVVNRSDLTNLMDHLAACNEGTAERVVTELRLKIQNKQDIPVQLVSVPANREGERVFLTAIVDLSERVEHEKALAEAKEFSDNIVQTVTQPLAVLDSEFRIISVNQAFHNFFQQPAKYVKGRVIEVMLNLWWSGNQLRDRLEKVLVKNEPLEHFQIEVEPRILGKRVLLLNARRLH